jgi:hypothetical protein
LSIDTTFITDPPVVLNTKPFRVLPDGDIDKILRHLHTDLLSTIDEYEMQGSGWILDELLRLQLTLLSYEPLRASTYVPLPLALQAKKAIVNVKNDDQLCFLWSIIAAIHPAANNAQRITHYERYRDNFVIDEVPMSLCGISKFERDNDLYISVYGYDWDTAEEDGGFVYPLRVTRAVEGGMCINLLLLESEDGGPSHYCLIKNFSRLVGSQMSKHGHSLHFCHFCLHGFSRQNLLEEHESECFTHSGQKTVFPTEPTVKFTSIFKQLEVPFVVYADFESLLEPVDIARGGTTK